MQTDNEADDAVAYIQQHTAAPIRRYFDSIVASRLAERTTPRDRILATQPKIGRARLMRAVWNTFTRYPASLFRKSMRSVRRLHLP
jgi:hypothetical protein